MKNRIYMFSVIAAGILWGLMSVFVRGLNALGFNSMQIMLMRAFISAFILFIIIFAKDRSMLRIRLKDIWIFIGSGVISLSFFSVCYFTTIIECGASVAVVLLYTSPVFVLLISAFVFKEKITPLKFLALVITFAGCVLVTGILSDKGSSAISAKGFVVGILSGLGYGLYSIFGRIALRKYEPLTVTFYSFVFAAVSMIPFSVSSSSETVFSVKAAFLFAGVAVFCTLLPFLLYTYGLSGLETGKAAIFATVEPLVGTLIGIFLWKESADFLKLVGIVMIFTAVILAQKNTVNKDFSD